MNANTWVVRIVPAVLGVATALLMTSCASTATRSSTVIEPPAPPGLPKPPALRVPNPPGVEPPSVGNLVRVEREPTAATQAQEAPTSPQPFAEAVWVPGHYLWQNNQYTWVPGKWERPPPGRTTWVPPRWAPRENGYLYTPGHWR